MNEEFQIGVVTAVQFSLFEDFLSSKTIKDFKADEPTVILGISVDEKACGAIAGTMESDDLFVIESFYVHPEVRRNGGGSLLLDTLMEKLHDNDEGIAAKLFFTEDSDDTECLYDFLIARGETESSFNDTDKGLVEHRFVIID